MGFILDTESIELAEREQSRSHLDIFTYLPVSILSLCRRLLSKVSKHSLCTAGQNTVL